LEPPHHHWRQRLDFKLLASPFPDPGSWPVEVRSRLFKQIDRFLSSGSGDHCNQTQWLVDDAIAVQKKNIDDSS
jgi:hypothetical protein